MKKKPDSLRCALIFLGPFPVGNVSTLRIMSYCKALAKKDIFIKVLLIAPTAEASVNNFRRGNVDGVEYQYISEITWKKANTANYIKMFYYIIGLFKSIKYIKEDNINCLLSYRSELLSNVFYRVLTRILGIPFILDKTEYPNSYFKLHPYKRKLEDFKLRMYDGLITITTELEEFYTKITKFGKEKYFLLPMTIDIDRYKNLIKNNYTKGYIAIVFGTHNRDGLFDSIKAYHKYTLLKKNDVFDLVIVGDFDELCNQHPENIEIISYVELHKLSSNIIFKGLMPINEVPQVLLDARCLLTTPFAYASGGFPTKLGEYLLSGNVVVATSAGEISNYLSHNKNILLSEPGDLDHVANNLLYVDRNQELVSIIGESGRKFASTVFNADTYSIEFIKFLKSFT
jgi:glycosyltransferase involved in cell wall biosynthesis